MLIIAWHISMLHYTICIVMYVVEAHYMPMNKLKLLLYKKVGQLARLLPQGSYVLMQSCFVTQV